jgi:hypothetical protein
MRMVEDYLMSLPQIGESFRTAGGRTAYRVEPERYGPSILATNLERAKKAKQKAEVVSQSRLQQREQAQATAWAKGKRLRELAYTFQAHESEPHTTIVTRRGGRFTKTASGDYVNHYLVTLAVEPDEDECTCCYFNAPGSLRPCAHIIGVRRELGEIQ